MTEEEVRGKLLLPFLEDLGFDLSEILLEKSFSIRLGKSKKVITGRSDILCKRNGRNLFIIELKNDSISIDQDDIDQAISYARLLDDNIAPFTIVTNGKVTRIFDSITKQELTGARISDQSSFWQNECTLSSDFELLIRYEALKKFVSFSPENLRQFCEYQVQHRMGPIVGNKENPYAKFVKELYVQRQALKDSFDDFLRSTKSVFAIVGQAGVGKTGAMCSLALQKLDNEFVFFYNAALLNKSPLQHIAHDLNGAFSNRSENDIVLKRLNELGEFLGKKVLIFIDAIDENIESDLKLELSEIALSSRSLNQVKIIISCKSVIWPNFLKKNGTPTHLFEELKKTHSLNAGLQNCPGFLLEDFTDSEIDEVIRLYKSAFDFRGEISKSLHEALKNGFFLRIFSEVYSKRDIPEETSDKELIKKYLERTFENTGTDFYYGLRVLSKIGKILIEYKYSSLEAFRDEGVDIESLIEKLELSLKEDLPEYLFVRNLLIRSSKEDSYNVSFYYSKIRDYIICYQSFRLDKMNDTDFHNVLEKFYENHVGQSAIGFYMKNAKRSHQEVLVKFKRNKSMSYVTVYDSYLEQHFKTFKDKFDPKTSGKIGILLPEDLLYSDGYALFPLEFNSDEKVQQVNLKNAFSDPYDDSLFFQKGVNVIHGSNTSLLVEDQDKNVREHVFKQLKDIINKGKIAVYNSDVLLMEQISTIVYFYWKKLGNKTRIVDFNLPRFNLIYPINLKELRVQIRTFLTNELRSRQRWDTTIKEEEIEQALRQDLPIPKLEITGDFPPFEELLKMVEILLDKGYKDILEHYLPYPDVSVSDAEVLYRARAQKAPQHSQIRSMQFSPQRAKEYIKSFFKYLDVCYGEFVDNCFPTLKDNFPFFKSLPHEYLVYINSDNFDWGYLGHRPSISGEVVVNFKEFEPGEDVFERKETKTLYAFQLNKILHNDYYHRIKTIDKMNTDRVDEYCVLRNWIYRFLKEDLKMIFKENGQ